MLSSLFGGGGETKGDEDGRDRRLRPLPPPVIVVAVACLDTIRTSFGLK